MEVLEFVLKYFAAEDQQFIVDNKQHLRITYFDYNWNINGEVMCDCRCRVKVKKGNADLGLQRNLLSETTSMPSTRQPMPGHHLATLRAG